MQTFTNSCKCLHLTYKNNVIGVAPYSLQDPNIHQVPNIHHLPWFPYNMPFHTIWYYLCKRLHYFSALILNLTTNSVRKTTFSFLPIYHSFLSSYVAIYNCRLRKCRAFFIEAWCINLICILKITVFFHSFQVLVFSRNGSLILSLSL